ncbi:MAG: hypothetical protein J0I84_05465 [Terrimonas sp.]|nr:hypothetical protein [Terrimonas sp.]OJY93350.1 MAG: hypothetical protein BGP13_17150 [Sphingobacteriales bacterium 40-81]
MSNDMEHTDILALWKSQNEKLDEAISINKKLLKENLVHKAKSALSGFKAVRWAGIIFGILWCAAVGFVLIVSWQYTNWFFKSAFIIHIAVSLIAVGLYIYHLVLLNNFDNSKTVVSAQRELVELKFSNLKTLGILWLQLPVFSIWFMTNEWMRNSPGTFWFIQVPIVLIELFIGIWLYRNLNYRSHQKKWFKWFIGKGEFSKIDKANSFLLEIDELDKK